MRNIIGPFYHKICVRGANRRLLTSSVLSIASRILPIAVLEPTPITTDLALPATTTVPWEAKTADSMQSSEQATGGWLQ
jgi:hypothetical protein